MMIIEPCDGSAPKHRYAVKGVWQPWPPCPQGKGIPTKAEPKIYEEVWCESCKEDGKVSGDGPPQPQGWGFR